MVPWEEYRLYVAVVEYGGLSAAGRVLGISPAKLSKRILQLENRLGTKLLNRTTRRVSTTLSGQKFYEDAAAILAEVERAESGVRGDASKPAGPLRVTAPTSLGRLKIVPHLPGFIERFPSVDLEVNLSDEFIDLMGGKFDLAVRIATEGQAGLVMHKLSTNHRILCAAPEYLERNGHPADLTDLQQNHKILATIAQLPWRLHGANGDVAFAGRSMVKTNSSEVVRELAIGGVGIALRSTWDVSGELRRGALVPVLPGITGAAGTSIYAAFPGNGPMQPTTQVFIDFLSGIFRSEEPADIREENFPPG